MINLWAQIGKAKIRLIGLGLLFYALAEFMDYEAAAIITGTIVVMWIVSRK